MAREGGDALLRTAVTRLGLSARGGSPGTEIARTIADLDGGGGITTAHAWRCVRGYADALTAATDSIRVRVEQASTRLVCARATQT